LIASLIVCSNFILQTPTFRYYENLSLAGIERKQVAKAYDRAWQSWADICNIQPIRVKFPQDTYLIVQQKYIDGPGEMLGYTNIPDFNKNPIYQVFDEGEAWTEKKFFDVSLHEIGHVLKINHLPVGNVMHNIIYFDLKGLQTGDIIEAQKVWGIKKFDRGFFEFIN
jgi:hypothetical protein